MNAPIMNILCWLGFAGALVAIVVYFVQIAIRPQWVRLISGAGLFFTGVGLAEAARILPTLNAGAALGGAVCVIALLTSVYFQCAATLRGRNGDRRAPAA